MRRLWIVAVLTFVLPVAVFAGGETEDAQEEPSMEVDDTAFSWLYGFYAHVKGTGTLTEEELDNFIRAFYGDEYRRYRDNDFEYPKLVARAMAALAEGGEEVMAAGRVFKMNTRVTLTNYNFQRKGYALVPVEESHRWVYPGQGYSSLKNVEVFLQDVDKLNFFPMSEEAAQAMLEERGRVDRNNEPVKTMYAVVHFTILPFRGPYYTHAVRNTRSFFGAYAVPAAVVKIEIYDHRPRGYWGPETVLEYMGDLTR